MATKQSCFVFDEELYKQVDGVAMGSPLGPSLANAFLCHHERRWLNDCPSEFKPLYYRRYVDDVFVLFSSPEHLPLFQAYLNSKHANISFTIENENGGTLPFLHILVSRDSDKFVTDIYRKPTFSGVYSNFYSFIPDTFKFGLVFTLTYRIFHLSSSFMKFHIEMKNLRNILLRNGYPSRMVERCLKCFLDKLYSPKEVVTTVPRKEVLLVLPFLGKVSLQVRTRLERLFSNSLPSCKLRIVFRSNSRLSSFFKYKDMVSKAVRSKVVYKFTCAGCNSSYIGKTMRHLNVRAAEHVGVSALTGKRVVTKPTAVSEHLFDCGSSLPRMPCLDDFLVLASASNNFELEIKESLLIHRDKPQLNNNVSSLPLYLFS